MLQTYETDRLPVSQEQILFFSKYTQIKSRTSSQLQTVPDPFVELEVNTHVESREQNHEAPALKHTP